MRGKPSSSLWFNVVGMEQLYRAERYLQRIREIYEGCPHKHQEVSFYEDDVISFFIHCHHVSDWIIQLNMVGETKKSVNDFINGHSELKLCADMCNGQKHCRLERVRGNGRPHMSGKNWRITSYVSESGQPKIFRAKYLIVSGSNIYDTLELAEKCMELWRGYVNQLALKAGL